MDNKSLILDALARFSEPCRLKELEEALQNAIKNRTLRRLLQDLAKEGKVVLTGGKRNRAYQLIHQAQETESSHPIFSPASLNLLKALKEPLYRREPCTYNDRWLKSYSPNETFYLSKKLRSQLLAEGRQTLDDTPAGTYANKIYDRLLIDLSYNSSRLEGNTYSLLDTQRLLLEGKAAEDKIDADRVMILNHKEAIRFLVKGIERVEVSEQSVRTLHYLLADGLVLPKDAGNIRQDGVKIAGSVYYPIDNYDRLKTLFSLILSKAARIENCFEQSFFLLAQLSYLQAFIDVNKRTARLAANIPLVKNNVVPISFIDIEKEDYQTAVIALYEFNELGPLAELYLFSYLKTCKEYQVTCEAIAFDPIRVRYRQVRRELIAQIIKQNIQKDKLQRTIDQVANKQIPGEDRQKFIADVLEDLKHLDVIKLVGLGVSRDEFEVWHENFSP